MRLLKVGAVDVRSLREMTAEYIVPTGTKGRRKVEDLLRTRRGIETFKTGKGEPAIDSTVFRESSSSVRTTRVFSVGGTGNSKGLSSVRHLLRV